MKKIWFFPLALSIYFTTIPQAKSTFAELMNHSKGFNETTSLQQQDWKVVQELYNTYFAKKEMLYRTEPRIPKIIHQIWLGSPLPERCRVLQQSWIKHHPDWQYILWTEKEIQAFGLTNATIYNASKNYGEKSDIARYEILYRIGGLYVDTDAECLKPLDVLHHCFDFYVGIGYGEDAQVWNGQLAATPGHPILRHCINTIQGRIPAINSYEVFSNTGPLLFTKCFFESLPSCSGPLVALPVTYFYPLPNYCREDKKPKQWIQEESFTIHYFHRSWFR